MTIIAGPCVIESPALLREVAGELARIKKELNVEIYFKASFDKANRTSLRSFRGPGIEEGIAMLEAIREEFGLPITTDFHTPEQIAGYGHRVDMVQIPAFLCRQTDMLIEAGKTGKIVNIKKAQFLNAEKMQFPVKAMVKKNATQLKILSTYQRKIAQGKQDLFSDDFSKVYFLSING